MHNIHQFIHSVLLEELKSRPQGISFKVIEDSEGDKNRGWRVDKLTASIEGKDVGYLKMSWIPKERFDRYYPNILHWVGLIQGKGNFNPKYSKWDMTTTLGLIKLMLDDQDYTEKASKDPRLEQMTPAEEKALYRKLVSRYDSKSFIEFRKHWMDKPLVDYIRVDQNYQRQGIAIAMYEEGAKHLATMGLRLYASRNQQPGAKAAWEWLQANAPDHVGMDDGRMFLSFL